MKLKENLVLRQVAQNWVVLPVGEATLSFTGMLNLNDSGAMLWKVLEKNPTREALVAALRAEYEVTEEQACADVEAFLKKLTFAGCIEE